MVIYLSSPLPLVPYHLFYILFYFYYSINFNVRLFNEAKDEVTKREVVNGARIILPL